MIKKKICKTIRLTQKIRFGVLNHRIMQKMKQEIWETDLAHWKKSFKYFLKQTKYTISQGFIDFIKDFKCLTNLYIKKFTNELNGYEIRQKYRIRYDLIKFVPYSLFIMIPGGQLIIPFYIYFFPNSIPSFFIFDTKYDQNIENFENQQQIAGQYLSNILIKKMTDLNNQINFDDFVHIQTFKKDFYNMQQYIDQLLDYRKFNSQQLTMICQFLGMQKITGTYILTKFIHIFTLYLPKYLHRLFYILAVFITRKKFKVKPFVLFQGNIKLNFFPFEYFKRKLLIFQITYHLKKIYEQDLAFDRYGLIGIEGNQIKDFTRERGITSISCYQQLRIIFNNQYIKIVTHPKFSDNSRLWYSVMLYNFLKKINHQMN